MKLALQSRSWGITTRLVLVATVPPFLMSLVVTVALSISGRKEVAATLHERGQLVAAALAETSQYGVVSGNFAYLDRNIRQLLRTDSSVSRIEILDTQRNVIVAAGANLAAGSPGFEMPIGGEVPDVDLFDTTGGPHASNAPGQGSVEFRERTPVGFVRVTMSEAPILAEKQRRLYWGVAVVLLATLFSGVAGLYLAQRLRAPLSAVMAALREIRQGRFSVALNTGAGGELGELQATIVEMANGLSVSQRQLESQVESRTRDLKEAMAAISEADADKRLLIARSNAAIEEERRRIAVEIHDHLNASLIVVNMKAQHIASLAVFPINSADTAEIQQTAEAISSTTQSLYSSARAIVKQLRPEIIDTLGLKGALGEMIRNYDRLHPDCSFTFYCEAAFPDLRGQLAITAYRLVQEALSNAVKHSEATCVSVRLSKIEHLPMVSMVIDDDGKGFDPAIRPTDSVGLIGMRERVFSCDGQIEIESARGEGTTVAITLPTTHPDQSY